MSNVINNHVVNGQLLGRTASGVGRSDLISDETNSTTAIVDATSAPFATFSNTPFWVVTQLSGTTGNFPYLFQGRDQNRQSLISSQADLSRGTDTWSSKLSFSVNSSEAGQGATRQTWAGGNLGSLPDCNLANFKPITGHYMTSQLATPGNCGATGTPWGIRWDVADIWKSAGKAVSGYIIQEIEMIDQASPPCVGGGPAANFYDHYWEVWWVSLDGNIYAFDPLQKMDPGTYPNHDIYSKGSYECRVGQTKTVGYPRFYPIDKRCPKDVWGYNKGNGVSGRVDLVGGGFPPGWSRGPERRLTGVFNCCADESWPPPWPQCIKHKICKSRKTVLTFGPLNM